ncbi:hypothetical protein Zmor_011623 [Zophobas morio]|uniref:CHK kinase-like domain-containing protein n=2 Tax=Zophobas morio TaxID=2755281 RepID=A0AA38ML55_9CUCU|nr:hypothetical protein Zmor_011623 [Zophobas morio]
MDVLQTRPAILSLIKTVSQEHGINNHVITDVKTNQKGEGYLGEIFMVTVKDTTGDKKQLEMVIKAAFIDEKVREMAPIRLSFENEIYFYTSVHPIYEKLDQEKAVSPKVLYVPKCIKVSVKDQEEMLALENLRVSGFEIFDKKLVLDDEHVKLIFKTYGRYHGYSFALRDQKPEEYARITKGFYNIYDEFMKNDYFGNHLKDVNKLVQATLVPGEDDKVIQKYGKYTDDNVVKIFGDITRQDFDYSAILHGDCWSNNMMFKYDDTANGRKPVDMRLLDFQLIKVGSPVCDLSYCLYSGASKKVFDNLNEYLQIYHDSLSSFVRELGSDPERLFPFSVLKEHWRKYARWGMIMSFAILKMKLINKEDLVDLTDGYDMDELVDVFANVKFNEEDYNKRIRGLLWHMYEVEAL